MKKDTDIELCGPFTIYDQSGVVRNIEAIRIFDEGYGIIDVYVHLETSVCDARLYEDPVVIRQLMTRLNQLGYTGPDFNHGDLGLQDDKLIVLEAPEEFNTFATRYGWKNLAEEFAEDDEAEPFGSAAGAASTTLLNALMQKFKTQK
jgi:hypothetical protein